MPVRRFRFPLAVAVLAAALGGCGGGGGDGSRAFGTLYVSAPLRGEDPAGRLLCRRARLAAARDGGAAGEPRVRVRCLDAGGPDGRWALARVGANARRAAEDSTAVAYLGEPDPRAREQSRPILRAAGIAALGAAAPAAAVREVEARLADR